MAIFKKRILLIYDEEAQKPVSWELSPTRFLVLLIVALGTLTFVLWNMSQMLSGINLRWRYHRLSEENRKLLDNWRKIQSKIAEIEQNLQHSRNLMDRIRWILRDTQSLSQGLPQPLQMAAWEAEKTLSLKSHPNQKSDAFSEDTLQWDWSLEGSHLKARWKSWQWDYDEIVLTLSQIQDQLTQTQQSEMELISLLNQKQSFLLALPVIKPVNGWYSSFFGYRIHPLTGVGEFHQGVDIVAEFGAPVMATGAGIVIYAGFDPGYGKWIEIDHGYGITTRYGHLSHIYVKPGQNVTRYDVIGSVGNTGRSTGTHLHYEVRLNGVAQNPLLFIWDEI